MDQTSPSTCVHSGAHSAFCVLNSAFPRSHVMTTTTVPHSPTPPLSHSDTRRSWQPNGDAHLIFQWVKFEGKSQSWVASAFGINQSTVSRIIQRYERWQAHAKERENGRLDHAERLRAQRWLTYERNELIVASCMRIANELEGCIDTSRSTIYRVASDPTRDIDVRTHHACIDRTGMCSRFLRLAHRINMDNLKLAALDPPPMAEPLSPEELAAEEAQAAADAAELAAARQKGSGVFGGNEHSTMEDVDPPKTPDPLRPDPPVTPVPGAPALTDGGTVEQSNAPSSTLNLEPGTLNSPAPIQPSELGAKS